MAGCPAGTAPPSSLKTLVARHRRPVGGAATVVATASSLTWIIVVPEKADDAGLIQAWLLQYGHSTCWAFLAIAAGGWDVHAPRPVTASSARVALVAFILFLLALAL